MKNTYMVAVSIPRTGITVYAETIAHNQRFAVTEVKTWFVNGINPDFRQSFADEAKVCKKKISITRHQKLTFKGAGRADQYHHHRTCKLCSSIYQKEAV